MNNGTYMTFSLRSSDDAKQITQNAKGIIAMLEEGRAVSLDMGRRNTEAALIDGCEVLRRYFRLVSPGRCYVTVTFAPAEPPTPEARVA